MKTKFKMSVLPALLMSMLFSLSPHAAPISGTPADASVINKDQIIYWMIKRGELSADATELEREVAIAEFTRRAGATRKGSLLEARSEQRRLTKVRQDKALKTHVLAAPDNEIETRVKVLAVLIDFPDLPYDDNRLTASDTPMYYADYSVNHYKNLLFSSNGYAGPQGQSLMTGYQYYQAESGGSFFFTGDVKGWVTADNDAAFYGGNDPDKDDADKAAQELVKEAVTKAAAGMSTAELAGYDVEDPFDLDNDGKVNEADGIIDHVMVFHSSIGEEAGGGYLGANAIWSHRYSVGATPYTIPGTNMKVLGYTMQPIDAATGVCVHEFGHDLGLPDEYDTTYSGKGSPVADWSVMAAGSWTGDPLPGSKPTGFSPYARSYLQQRYKGNWITEQQIALAGITSSGLEASLVEAVNHEQVNQLSIEIPPQDVEFKQPYSGQYQYYSGQGHMLNNAMSFDIELPSATPLTLSMKAHWKIETDYDYAQVLVDGVAIAGNLTKSSNGINSARNILTGNSGDIAGAEGVDAWVGLTFDMSAYAGRDVQVAVRYVTDQGAGDYGIAIDDIAISQGSTQVFGDDAEAQSGMLLQGFSRIGDKRPGGDRRYIVQLRSHNGVDAGLKSSAYDAGVLLWLENSAYSDNNVGEHPGYNLIGVVDADQNLIGTGGSAIQMRDAAFSLYNQSTFPGDANLSSVKLFDDSRDYSAPLQPDSGLVLPHLGLTMEVMAQDESSTAATVKFNYTPISTELAASINAIQNDSTFSFSATVTGGDGQYSYAWDFGVANATSTLAAPSYTYTAQGSYTVTLTVTDGNGDTVSDSTTVVVSATLMAAFSTSMNNLTVSFNNTSSGGVAPLTYLWSFGDGQSSTAQSPTHTYASGGNYMVNLRVTDANNLQRIAIGSITLTATEQTGAGSDSSGGSLGGLTLILLTIMGLRRRFAQPG